MQVIGQFKKIINMFPYEIEERNLDLFENKRVVMIDFQDAEDVGGYFRKKVKEIVEQLFDEFIQKKYRIHLKGHETRATIEKTSTINRSIVESLFILFKYDFFKNREIKGVNIDFEMIRERNCFNITVIFREVKE